jgi:hypothetical protein
VALQPPRSVLPSEGASCSRPASPVPVCNAFSVLTPENVARLADHEAHQAHLKELAAMQAARAHAQQQQQQPQRGRQRTPRRLRAAMDSEHAREERLRQGRDPVAAAVAAMARPLPALPPPPAQQQHPADAEAQRDEDMAAIMERLQLLERALLERRGRQGNVLQVGPTQLPGPAAADWSRSMHQWARERVGGAAPTDLQITRACQDVLASPLMVPWAGEVPPSGPERVPAVLCCAMRLALVGRGWDPPDPDADYGEGAVAADGEDCF